MTIPRPQFNYTIHTPSSHDVPWRQLHASRVILGHEALPVRIEQVAALSSHCLRDQECAPSVGGIVKGGGVELRGSGEKAYCGSRKCQLVAMGESQLKI